MLHRFVSAASVAAVGIALAALTVLLIPDLTLKQASPVLVFWCLAPALWGVWAMLTPDSWVPRRLPLWGTLLGVIGGILAALVVNLPQRVLSQSWPLATRIVAVFVIAAFYYVLWTIVAAVYRRLTPAAGTTSRSFGKAA